jgi:ribonuclease HII
MKTIYQISLMNPDSQPGLEFETELWNQGYSLIVGVDEAGRGCLAGPVVAAAVICPPNMRIKGVKDSKKMSAKARERTREIVLDTVLAYGIGTCSPAEVDEMNILWAAMEAMRRAVSALSPAPDFVLIDGNRCFPDSPWPFRTIIKGDALSHSIAAASVLAKTHRDNVMRELNEQHPGYGWDSNKGYPTEQHYAALEKFGVSNHHRKSFRLS